MKSQAITASATRYLKAIFNLQNRLGNVRQIDIARELNVKPPSCFSAILSLQNKGFVREDNKKHLTLSPAAEIIVSKLKRKESLLQNFFTQILGIPAQQAQTEAEKLEYAVSEDASVRLCKLLEFWDQHTETASEYKNFTINRTCKSQCADCPIKDECDQFYQE